jgi:multidrug efflux pump subunit AcrB
MNRWARFGLFVLACAVVFAGFAIASAPQSVFPAIALARVEIFADAPDLTAEDVRSLVAAPLESALATAPALRATRTYADPGRLELELDFDPGSDPREDLRTVQDTLAQMRARLPVTDVTSLIEGPNMEPVVSYAVTSASTGQAALLQRIENALVPVFTGTPGLGRLAVFGGPQAAYAVTLDPRALAAAGISARDVASGVRDANQPRVVGTRQTPRERQTIVAGRALRGSPDLERVRIPVKHLSTVVPLSALGRVTYGDEPTGRNASFDATRAVILNVYPVASGDAVGLKRSSDERVARLRALLPADAKVTVAWDQTRLIVASQTALRDEMLAGAVIALLVILWFLRDRALTLAAAVVLPIALALTMLILVRAGLTLDLMTVGGLAIAIGLIIDETIVVVEAIASALEGRPPAERGAAIAAACRRVAKPLAASTAANVVVFLPLAFLSGIPGFFFRALAITLAVALVVSIALSLTLAPHLAGALRARAHATARVRRFESGYIAGLGWAMRHTAIVYAGAALAVVLAFALLVRLPSDFLPEVNEGQFEIKYSLPPGSPSAGAESTIVAMERAVLADPAVQHEARLSGVDTNGYNATPADAGTIRVTLATRRDSFDDVAARLRKAIALVDPNIAVEIHQLLEDQINDLSGTPEPIQLIVHGASPRRIARIASRLADDIDDIRGVVDPFDGVLWQPRIVHASPLPGSTLGARDFADALQARLDGIAATEITSEYGSLPVVVRVDNRRSLEHAAALGGPLLLPTVQEENGSRVIRVTAGLENVDLSTVIARIERQTIYQRTHLPPGYSIEIGGAIAAQQAAFREFASVFAIALVLVFAVLLATFNSFRLPLVVLAAVPLAPIGVAAALALTKTPLNVASFMGILLLIGIVVRNGILLVERANVRVAEGATRVEAMERSAIERLRPILMTTVATLGALAPLALGIGAGSEMERPLAIAVIGGIVSATALTLVLIPVLYVGNTPWPQRRWKAWRAASRSNAGGTPSAVS